MKSGFTFVLGALSMASTLVAATAADEEIFVTPSLTELAGKVAFDAATQLASDKKMTYENAYSLNLAQDIPSTTHVLGNKVCHVIGLGTHMREIADSLKNEGRGLIIAPASYGVLFTEAGVASADVMKHIDEVLAKVGSGDEKEKVVSGLGELKEVIRATFVKRDGKLQLLSDEKGLTLGERVWRKTPDGVKEEIFHSEEEFMVSIRNAGLTCEEIKRPCFFGEVKWQAYNLSRKEGEVKLGSAYIDHNPFTIFVVSKKASA